MSHRNRMTHRLTGGQFGRPCARKSLVEEDVMSE